MLLRKTTGALLSLILVLSPLSAHAQETPDATSTSDTVSDTVATDVIIPVYFFLHHKGEVPLGVVSTTPLEIDYDYQLWLAAYTPYTDGIASTTPEEIVLSSTFAYLEIQFGSTTNRTSIYNDNVASTLGAASYQVATTNGTYTDTYTGSAASDWSMVIAAFKAATTSSSGSGSSPDATSSQTTLFKSSDTSTFGGASYTIATTSGAITDTYTTAASTNWVMAAIALRPATSTSGGGGSSTGTTTRYFHQDYLNSTNVTSDKLGNKIQVLDYYPYGATRISNTTGANEPKQFIGQYTDPETNLSYLNARYYNNTNGQFVSQDPIFQQIGSPSAEKMANRAQQEILKEPQALNSYSYSKDNPINIKDPSGLIDSRTAEILGLYAKVLSLISQIIVLSGGGGSANPVAASTAMFARSTTISPQQLNINTGNQALYGNVVEQIKKSNEFNEYLKKQLKDNRGNGSINVPADDSHSLTFNSGDLFWSLHAVKAGLSGKQSSDGSWNIQVSIQDKYNFEYKTYGSSYKSAGASTVNNIALIPQYQGIVTPYDININFDYTFKP